MSNLDLEEISNLVNIIGWFAAGLWFLWKFYRHRENYAKIDLKVSAGLIEKSEDKKIIEVKVEVINTGHVRHIIRDMTYNVRGASIFSVQGRDADPLELDFPFSIAQDRRLFPASWEYSFAEPNCTSTYRQCIIVSTSVDLIKIDAKMLYEDDASDFHSAVWFGKI